MSGLVISCPNCGTRYNTTAKAIGPNGRMVRCARCSETWFVSPPDATEILDESPDALALEELESESQMDKPQLSAIEPSMLDPIPSNTQSEFVEPSPEVRPVAPAASIGADVMMRDQADRAKLARRRRILAVIWAVPLILVLIAGIYAFLNRQEIVNRHPQSATLYQAVGLDVKLNGLDIDPPVATTTLVDGTPVVRVEGRVRNITGQTRPVPFIQLTLHNETGERLAQWFVEPSQPTLPGRGSLTFQTEYADPPEGVSRMAYQFADED